MMYVISFYECTIYTWEGVCILEFRGAMFPSLQQIKLVQIFQILIDVLSTERGMLKYPIMDFPGGAVVKNLPANAGDMSSIPGPGRFHRLWSN